MVLDGASDWITFVSNETDHIRWTHCKTAYSSGLGVIVDLYDMGYIMHGLNAFKRKCGYK